MNTYKKIKATVIDSKLITPTSFTIKTTKPVDFTFEATQFTDVGIRIKNKEFSPGRFPFPWLIQEAGMDYWAMSIATSPTRPYLEYAVRISNSAFKQEFINLSAGDEIDIQGPIGDFNLQVNHPATMIAGGIFITPLKGMLEYAVDKKLSIPIN